MAGVIPIALQQRRKVDPSGNNKIGRQCPEVLEARGGGCGAPFLLARCASSLVVT
jgi:hypothetical protein